MWDSCTFPGQGKSGETRLSVMAGSNCASFAQTLWCLESLVWAAVCVYVYVGPGGARNPDIVHMSEGELANLALSRIQRHLVITATPDVVVAGVHKECIPQAEVGHMEKVGGIRRAIAAAFQSRLHLLGNSYDTGLGAADCVAAAVNVAKYVASKGK